MYDAIVVGGRSAGASTAMLLARRGRSVLVVDRAALTSDVLSGHTIQPAGLARLARWGLLEPVRAAGAPFTSHVRFDFGGVVLDGKPEPVDGIDATVCIRRTVIDPLIADAAVEAGAEVRLGVSVSDLLYDGDRVVGIAGRDVTGRRFEERARVVVGADGARSFVARAVGAPTYLTQRATTVAAYSYWRGLDVDGIELYARPGRFFVVAPTNDGLTLVAQQLPVNEGALGHGRLDEAFLDSMADVPQLVDRIGVAERAERFRFARIADSFFRRPAGPGWALVGDAGYHKDPITAQGMTDAFRDADLLAAAIDEGLGGDLAASLADYHRTRDVAALPMYELTSGLAELGPVSPEIAELTAALQHQPAQIARFLGVIAGSVPVYDFFSTENFTAIVAERPAA